MKTPQSFLPNLIIIMLIFSLALGAFSNSLARQPSTIAVDRLFYGDVSSILLGIPFLIMGVFFLLPAQCQLSFIKNTWLRLLPVNKSESGTPWVIGVAFVFLGCVLISSLFVGINKQSDLINHQSIPSLSTGAITTHTIPREPTWTMYP